MSIEAKLLLGLIWLLVSLLPVWRRIFPWTLHISFDELRGWRFHIDREPPSQ